jgi:NTP pyrophosphatase (non-canonical NTP hydrolase)
MQSSDQSPALISLDEYQKHVRSTTKLSRDVLSYALLGLFGEVGSVMEAVKKREREGVSYLTFEQDAREELGDAFWYFTLAANELSISLQDVASDVIAGDQFSTQISATGKVSAPFAQVHVYIDGSSLLIEAISLGRSAGNLLSIVGAIGTDAIPLMTEFLKTFLRTITECGLSLVAVLESNIRKTSSRFLPTAINTLPNFDADFSIDERIPEVFEIEIVKRHDGKSAMKFNGVFIGDPLSDNIAEVDGYRFHDVFHLANAAVLGWSPVFRALIKHKRKSRSEIDEAQDSGRAIVVEEGLTAWIFSRSKEYDHFAIPSGLTYDMLKVVQQFVKGYEVEACPLWLWEHAILEGYKLFRQLRDEGGGVIVGNRKTRTVTFRSTA